MMQTQQAPMAAPEGWDTAARRSEYDVTNRVRTTDSYAVRQEICRLLLNLYPDASSAPVSRAFSDCVLLYRGEGPGYRACDTAYHNLQHVLDVALATARLMDGYERAAGRWQPLGARLFTFGIVVALFHDVGYLRHRNDVRHSNGAEYTLRHVSRGARFLERYMRDIGLPDLAHAAGRIIHFTGYEIPVADIEVPSPVFRLIGNMLGTADILAQMADRCYLEKCRDRLFPEFVAGGLACSGSGATPAPGVLFISAEDLLRKTPAFYGTALDRLNAQLGAACRYFETGFAGQNPYLDVAGRNIRYAEKVAMKGDLALLRRVPPPSGVGGALAEPLPRIAAHGIEQGRALNSVV
ncbi:MAG TPA: HD domain-containing protein [Burkholderiales bacterium]|nr:HD domain-containing protein [Burkholderiales bacterium]